MKYYEKLNELSENLIALQNKLGKADKEALLKDDLEELLKIEDLITFYMNTIVELVMEHNKEIVKENKGLVTKLVKEMEEFISKVNENINEEYL